MLLMADDELHVDNTYLRPSLDLTYATMFWLCSTETI